MASKSTERRLRAQQAKDFIISQVIDEAKRENVPLSEVEQKMLYFTETQETLPDMYEVNDQFEREYNDAAYENKIADLLRNIQKRNHRESPDAKDRWKQAIADLRKEDHYLLVMDQSLHPASDFWTVAKWSSGLVACLFLVIALWDYFDHKGWIPKWATHVSPGLVIYGAVGVWFVSKLARLGVLGDVLPFIHSRKHQDDLKNRSERM